MNEMTPSDKNKETPNGFIKALKALWRLFLLLVTGVILGGVIYWGFIQLYVNAVQVGQTTLSRLNVVETQNAQQQSQMITRLDQFAQRIGELEKQQSQQSESNSDLQSRVQTLEQMVEKQGLLLGRLDVLDNRISALESDITTNTKNDQDLKNAILADDSPVAVTKREVKVLKAMELISRAKLYLMQNNVGLARSDIEMAHQSLLALKEETPEYQKPVVDEWLQRVELVLKNLPGYPVLAADDRSECARTVFALAGDISLGSRKTRMKRIRTH